MGFNSAFKGLTVLVEGLVIMSMELQ